MKNEKIAELLINGIEILKSIHKKNLEVNKTIEDFLKSVNEALGVKEEEKKDEEGEKKEEPKKRGKPTKSPLEEKTEEFKEELKKYAEYMEKLAEASKMPAPYVITGDWASATTGEPLPEVKVKPEESGAVKEVEIPEETEPNWKEGDVGAPTEGFKDSSESGASGGGMAGKIWCAVCNEYHDKEETVTTHIPPAEDVGF